MCGFDEECVNLGKPVSSTALDHCIARGPFQTARAARSAENETKTHEAPEARHALRNARYSIHTVDGATERRVIANVDDYLETLSGPFQIRLPDAPQLRARLQEVIDENK